MSMTFADGVRIFGAGRRKARRASPNIRISSAPPNILTSRMMVDWSSDRGLRGGGATFFERMAMRELSCTIQSARLIINGTLLATKSDEPLTMRRAGLLSRRWAAGSSSDVSMPGLSGTGMPLSAKWLLNVPTTATNMGQAPPASSPWNSFTNALGATVGISTIRVAEFDALANMVVLVSLDGNTSMELA